MNCWCETSGVPNFKCVECEQAEKWKALTNEEKRKALTYFLLLDSNKFDPKTPSHAEVQMFVLEHDICLSSIPLSRI